MILANTTNLRTGLNVIHFIVVFVIASLVLFSETEDLLGWTTLVIGAVLVLFIAMRFLMIGDIILVAYVLRATLSIFQYYVGSLPEAGLDAKVFESTSWLMAQSGTAFSTFRMDGYFYSWLISLIYRITGRSEFMMQAINVIIGTVVVLLVFVLSSFIWNAQTGKFASAFAAIFPTLALRSAITLRETFMVFFVTLGAISFVKWRRDGYSSQLLLCLFSFTVSSIFHTTGFFFIIGVLMISIMDWFKKISTKKKSLKTILQQLLLIAFISVVLIMGIGTQKLLFLSNDENSFEALAETQAIAARGRTAYPSFLVTSSVVMQVVFLPIRSAYLMFSPFLWDIGSLQDIAGLVDGFLFFIMIWSIYKKRKELFENKEAFTLFILLTVAISFTSLGVSNIGTAIRHRGKFTTILIAISSGTMEKGRIRRFLRRGH